MLIIGSSEEPNFSEGGFSVLTRRALLNASFDSVGQLAGTIDVWASHRDDDPQPFIWTNTVEEIIAKVKCGRATLTALTETTTDHSPLRCCQVLTKSGTASMLALRV